MSTPAVSTVSPSLTKPAAFKKPLDKPAIKALVIGWMATDMGDTDIVEALKTEKRITVTRQAVNAFRKRHKEDIEPAAAQVVAVVTKQIADFRIAQQVNRIAVLDDLLTKSEAWIEENSLSEVAQRFDEDGNLVGETTKFRADVVNAVRGLLKDAATETDQLPRGRDSGDMPTNFVLIRERIIERGARLEPLG